MSPGEQVIHRLGPVGHLDGRKPLPKFLQFHAERARKRFGGYSTKYGFPYSLIHSGSPFPLPGVDQLQHLSTTRGCIERSMRTPSSHPLATGPKLRFYGYCLASISQKRSLHCTQNANCLKNTAI
jgi:hypothetical protein